MKTTISIVQLHNDFCFKLYSPLEEKYLRFHTITEANNYCERNGIEYQHEWD